MLTGPNVLIACATYFGAPTGAYSRFQVSGMIDQMGAKIKTQKNP